MWAYCSLVPSALGALAAAAGDALHLRTWRSLVRVQGLTTPEAVTLMARLAGHASAGGWADGAYGFSAVMRPSSTTAFFTT